MVFVAVKASAEESGEEMFDWEPLMEAISQVESEGNAKARNGNCCGAMQIKPILVEDCNLILRSRGSKKKYTLKDRFNVKKSKEMFVLIMSKYIAIRPVRRIGSERMRSICIENEWYDSGTNEEYGHLLFDLCQRKKNLTDDDIVMIVLDIIEHTARCTCKSRNNNY